MRSVRSKNGGDDRPRFWQDAAVTASCRPSSSRPSLLSWPLVYPPLRVGFLREEPSPYRSAAAFRHVGGASIRRSSLREDSRGVARRSKKIGGAKLPSHPQDRSAALALLAALFLAALCTLLRHEFLLGTLAAQLLPVTRDYNRWAERSTLIQDVDYG